MKRVLQGAAAVVSLILGVIVIVVWIKTRNDGLFEGMRARIGSLQLHSTAGETEFVMAKNGPWLRYFLFPIGGPQPKPSDHCRWNGWGFGFDKSTISGANYRVVVPDWFLIAIALMIPANYSIEWFRNRRTRAQNLCRRCGYDLRATPERCPECGLVVK